MLISVILCCAAETVAPINYPIANRGSVVEEIHGVKVADPYRWLEQDVTT